LIADCILQIAKGYLVMQLERVQLSHRLLEFGATVIRVARRFRKDHIDLHVVKQVVRSATSAETNYQEACGAESRADFIHKLQISLKELNETLYWLRLLRKVSHGAATPEMAAMIQENKELCAIIARSVITAKERMHATKLSKP
jgi:four helix bundle protein